MSYNMYNIQMMSHQYIVRRIGKLWDILGLKILPNTSFSGLGKYFFLKVSQISINFQLVTHYTISCTVLGFLTQFTNMVSKSDSDFV